MKLSHAWLTCGLDCKLEHSNKGGWIGYFEALIPYRRGPEDVLVPDRSDDAVSSKWTWVRMIYALELGSTAQLNPRPVIRKSRTISMLRWRRLVIRD